MNDDDRASGDFGGRMQQAAAAARVDDLVVIGFLVPVMLTVFAVVDAHELDSGGVEASLNAVVWLGFGTIALFRIQPWRPRHEIARLRVRLWNHSLWGWIYAALLALTSPLYEWTTSDTTDTRTMAGQFWHEVADAIPLLDVPESLGWGDPLPDHPIAVGVIFLMARVVTLLVIVQVIRYEWDQFETRRGPPPSA